MANEPLYNPNDGLTGRDGGPYLDVVQAREAEIRRAEVEGREPNLDNPGAYAGIPLYTAAQMMDTITVNNTPSQEGRTLLDPARNFEASVNDPDTLLTHTGEFLPRDEIKAAQDAAEGKSDSVPNDGETGANKGDEVDPFNL